MQRQTREKTEREMVRKENGERAREVKKRVRERELKKR